MTIEELDAMPQGTVVFWQQLGSRARWPYPKYARKSKKGTWVGIGHPWVPGYGTKEFVRYLMLYAIGKFQIATFGEKLDAQEMILEDDLDESDLL